MALILYFGDDRPASTTLHRAKALERLGHKVLHFQPAGAVQGFWATPFLDALHFRTGYRLLQQQLQEWLLQLLKTIPKPELVWVNSGELLGPRCLKMLRQLGCPIVLYNNDDPTGGRDGRRFDLLLKAIPLYDLCVIRRQVNVAEYLQLGAKRLMLVRMSYDEQAHQPFATTEEIPLEYRSEVAFIGTWMRNEKRDAFLLKLIREGLPLSIWGGRWQKSPYWKELRLHWRGNALSGRAYVAAMQGAKICLGLLSSGNRDLHTRRSVEIPFAGGLLCAQRTLEHQQLYQEGVEAVFWEDASECAEQCWSLLQEPDRREVIRLGGMQRVRELGVGNEAVCQAIVEAALRHSRSGVVPAQRQRQGRLPEEILQRSETEPFSFTP